MLRRYFKTENERQADRQKLEEFSRRGQCIAV